MDMSEVIVSIWDLAMLTLLSFTIITGASGYRVVSTINGVLALCVYVAMVL